MLIYLQNCFIFVRRRKRRQEHERDYKDSGVNVGEVDSDSENARLTGSTSLNDFGEKVVNQRSAFIAAENLAISSNDNKGLILASYSILLRVLVDRFLHLFSQLSKPNLHIFDYETEVIFSFNDYGDFLTMFKDV